MMKSPPRRYSSAIYVSLYLYLYCIYVCIYVSIYIHTRAHLEVVEVVEELGDDDVAARVALLLEVVELDLVVLVL